MSNHIGVVLDMSGSMSAARGDTVESVSNYIKELQKELKDGILHLTIFDTVFENWIDSKPLEKVNIDNVLEEYHPRGGTALYDAIGYTLNRMEDRVDQFDRAILVVITDGYENSSVKYDRKKINSKIKKLNKTNNWTIVYLGANVDSWAEAEKLGIHRGNTAFYSLNRNSLRRTSGGLATASLGQFNAPGATPDFFVDSGVNPDFREDEESFNVNQILDGPKPRPTKKRTKSPINS